MDTCIVWNPAVDFLKTGATSLHIGVTPSSLGDICRLIFRPFSLISYTSQSHTDKNFMHGGRCNLHQLGQIFDCDCVSFLKINNLTFNTLLYNE